MNTLFEYAYVGQKIHIVTDCERIPARIHDATKQEIIIKRDLRFKVDGSAASGTIIYINERDPRAPEERFTYDPTIDKYVAYENDNLTYLDRRK